MFTISELTGEYPGVHTSLTESLRLKLQYPKRKHLIESGTVRIKLSGDGTRVTCKQNSSMCRLH